MFNSNMLSTIFSCMMSVRSSNKVSEFAETSHKVSITDLTNIEFAKMLADQLESEDPQFIGFSKIKDLEDFKKKVGTVVYPTFFEQYRDANHLPHGYVPGYTQGDGKCFIHAIVNTLCLHYFSLDGSGSLINRKLSEIKACLCDIMPDKMLLMDLHSLEFEPVRGTINQILAKNAVMINALVQNIAIAVVHNWYEPMFMSHVPAELLLSDACDFRQNLGISMKNGMVDPASTTITSFDGIARGHVCKLLGIHKLHVLQFANNRVTMLNGKVVSKINMDRRANPLYQIVPLNVPNRAYAGFTIDIPLEQLVLLDEPIEMMIHTFDTSHYEILMAYSADIRPVPCKTKNSPVTIPEHTIFPGREVVAVANEVEFCYL